VEPLLESVQTSLWSITRHITLLSPLIEDGNNFGADVQQMVLKQVQERENLVSGYLGDLATYFYQRGTAMEKIGGSKWRGEGGVVEVMESKVEKGSTEGEDEKDEVKTGGEEEDKTIGGDKTGKKRKAEEETASKDSRTTTKTTGSTTVNKTVKTTRTTKSTPSVLPDYVHYLVSLDIKWYLYLKDALRQAGDSCLIVKDMVEKNREKIEHPKGKGEEGGNGMSMF